MVYGATGAGSVKVIVTTSDKYLHILKPFSHLFNKYWSADQQVLIGGFTPPDFELPGNFSFHSIGKFEDYPIGKWSNGLIDLLDVVDDEAFVLMLDDYLLKRPVDVLGVRMAYDYARQYGYMLRFDLTWDRLFALGPRYPDAVPDYGHLGHLDLVRSEPQGEFGQYHMSLMPAVWRRDNLLKVLQPDWSPWDVEIAGTRYLQEHHAHDLLVLGTRQAPIRIGLGLRGGNPGKLDLDAMRAEDVLEMGKLGIL